MKLIQPISDCTFSLLGLLLLLVAHQGHAQTAAQDTVRTNGVRIGFNLAPIAYYFITEQKHRSYEIMADVGYKKLLYVAEAGVATIAKMEPTYSFQTNGYYGRLGIERNMLKGGNDVLFFGARYGLSFFDFQSDYFVAEDDYWGDFPGSFGKQTFTAHWLEGVTGLKGRIWKNFYLGFTARFKLKVALSGNKELGAITIPGYGDASQNAAFGFSYYVFYQIPFKKQ